MSENLNAKTLWEHRLVFEDGGFTTAGADKRGDAAVAWLRETQEYYRGLGYEDVGRIVAIYYVTEEIV